MFAMLLRSNRGFMPPVALHRRLSDQREAPKSYISKAKAQAPQEAVLSSPSHPSPSPSPSPSSSSDGADSNAQPQPVSLRAKVVAIGFGIGLGLMTAGGGVYMMVSSVDRVKKTKAENEEVTASA